MFVESHRITGERAELSDVKTLWKYDEHSELSDVKTLWNVEVR